MKEKHGQTDRRRQTSGAESYSSGKPRKHFQKLPGSPGMLSCVMVYMFVCLCACVSVRAQSGAAVHSNQRDLTLSPPPRDPPNNLHHVIH